MDFKEYMTQTKEVNRWFVAKIFVAGAFVGAVLTVLYMWIAII